MNTYKCMPTSVQSSRCMTVSMQSSRGMTANGQSLWCMAASGQRCTVYTSPQGVILKREQKKNDPEWAKLPFPRHTAHSIGDHPKQTGWTLSPQICFTAHTHLYIHSNTVWQGFWFFLVSNYTIKELFHPHQLFCGKGTFPVRSWQRYAKLMAAICFCPDQFVTGRNWRRKSIFAQIKLGSGGK